MAGLTGVNACLVLLCAAGVGVSYYAYFVENNVEHNEKYEAMCDVNEHISCTKVFASKHAKGFGIVAKYLGENHILNQPNSVYGIFFYAFLAILSLINNSFVSNIQLSLSFISNCLSMYLGYLLMYVIKSLCLVCVATYAINFLIFITTIWKLKKLAKKSTAKRGQKSENTKQKKATKKNK